jgi:hypothetical protein
MGPILLIITLIIIIVVCIFYFLPTTVIHSFSFTGPVTLDATKTIVTKENSEFWVDIQKSTVQFFLYLSPMQRTVQTHSCGQDPNSGEALCETDRFPVCSCTGAGNNCSNCIHKDYNQILSVLDILQIEISTVPDAGRQSQPSIQLLLRTTSGGNVTQSYIETFPLPPITYQNWTMITISRNGRQLDIYYNESLVLSTFTQNVITPETFNTQGVQVGNTDIIGEIGLLSIHAKAFNNTHVIDAYRKHADTRGRPNLALALNSSDLIANSVLPSSTVSSTTDVFGFLQNISLCPSGLCFQGPSVRPASPLLNWTSSYN